MKIASADFKLNCMREVFASPVHMGYVYRRIRDVCPEDSTRLDGMKNRAMDNAI